MNSTTRTVISICFALLSTIILISKCYNRSQKRYQYEHTWTPELEMQMRDVFKTQIGSIHASESAKDAYIDCCFSRIKEAFPNGPASMDGSNMSDSMRIAMMKECAKCATVLTEHINVWDSEALTQLKLQLYSSPEVKLLPQADKEPYVDCLAFKIKTKFPYGLGKAGKDSLKNYVEKARHDCLTLLVNKTKNTEPEDTVTRYDWSTKSNKKGSGAKN